MAIDFPNSPTNGESFTSNNKTWVYNSAENKWVLSASSTATASYVTLGTDAVLTNERVLTAGTGISLTDGGAGGNVTVATSAILPTIVDNKGELIVGTANDTVARLANSTNNGDVLIVDTSTSTGLRWQGQANMGRNLIINGGFDVWQRGTSFANTTTYTSDRWQAYRDALAAGATLSRQTSAVDGFTYAARMQRNSGNTSTAGCQIATTFETIDVKKINNKVLTLSFYARCGANYSPTSSLLNVSVLTGTGTDGNLAAGLTSSATYIAQNVTLTTSFQRFTLTGSSAIANTVTQLGVLFYFTPVGTAGVNDWIEITGVQLEVGPVATGFDFEPFETTLRKCQRYYEKSYNVATAPGTNVTNGAYVEGNSTDGSGFVNSHRTFLTRKRSMPTMTFYRTDGTSGSWNYERNGVNGTAGIIVVHNGESSIGCRTENIGAAWVAASIYGHWVADSEL